MYSMLDEILRNPVLLLNICILIAHSTTINMSYVQTIKIQYVVNQLLIIFYRQMYTLHCIMSMTVTVHLPRHL